LAALMFFHEDAQVAAEQKSIASFQLIGDFSLNVANELTAHLLAQEGLSRLVPSYDLNWEQLAAMLRRMDPGLLEVVVHQHMPMFHMEHCVFAAMLSNGKDSRDCGRPCDRHKVELRDRTGAAFPLLADTGCRNTIFNSVAQSGAEYIPSMLALGVRHFRVELLRESAVQVAPLLEHYARVINGLEPPRQAWRSLQVLNQLGVTRGTLQLA
jgi:putative protease